MSSYWKRLCSEDQVRFKHMSNCRSWHWANISQWVGGRVQAATRQSRTVFGTRSRSWLILLHPRKRSISSVRRRKLSRSRFDTSFHRLSISSDLYLYNFPMFSILISISLVISVSSFLCLLRKNVWKLLFKKHVHWIWDTFYFTFSACKHRLWTLLVFHKASLLLSSLHKGWCALNFVCCSRALLCLHLNIVYRIRRIFCTYVGKLYWVLNHIYGP